MQLREQFTLTHGLVEIHYPSDMTPDDLKDFEDTLTILIRILRRRNAGVATPEQGARPVRINGEPGSRSAA